MTEPKHLTILECRDVVGSGLEIHGILPKGFRLEFTDRESGVDGKTFFMLWSARWVQFETPEWEAMQKANGALFANAPQMFEQLKVFRAVLAWGSVRDGLGETDHATILKNLNAVIERAE
jgi:hypothetical protein